MSEIPGMSDEKLADLREYFDNHCSVTGERIRPSIDESMLATAEVWSRRSTCSRLAVGAVLARGGRVLSCGYNGAPVGLEHCIHDDDASCIVSIHAEANALISAGRFGVQTDGATLYLTHAPCIACSGLIINAGIVRVMYAESYRSDDGIDRLRLAGISVGMGFRTWLARAEEKAWMYDDLQF